MGDQVNSQALQSNTTFLNIRTAILASADSKDLSFNDNPPRIGAAVFGALSEDPEIEDLMLRMTYNSSTNTIMAGVMPAKVHDVPQMWLTNELSGMREMNFLTQNERCHFNSSSRTTFEGFAAPLPSVVAESGRSDIWLNLIAGMELWLQGGRPNVQLVFLFNWPKWVRVNGGLRLETRTDGYARLFSPSPMRTFWDSTIRGEVFGVSGVFPGQNAVDVWHLSLRLRQTA
ncbi:hypothetical protein BDV12DRAFT_187851 [Aspergillus spectabilis]